MLPRFFQMICLVLWLAGMVFTAAYASPNIPIPTPDYPTSQMAWEKMIDNVRDDLSSEKPLEADRLYQYKDELKKIRESALQFAETFKGELSSERDLLKALGDAPEQPEAESKDIQDQRKRLNDSISSVDSRLKNTNLTIARAEELIVAIEAMEQERMRNQLLARDVSMWDVTTPQNLLDEIINYVSGFDRWPLVIVLISGLAVSIALSIKSTVYLNNLFFEANGVTITRPIRRRHLAGIFTIAFIALLLRADIIQFGEYLLLSNLFQIIAAVYLSVALLLLLIRIHFVQEEQKYDSMMLSQDERKDFNWLWNGVKRIAQLILLVVTPLSLAGYINLGLYLSVNIFITALSCFLFIWLRSVAVALNNRLARYRHKDEDLKKKLSPVTITILEPLLALFSLGITAFFWGTTAEDVEVWVDHVSRGITVGDITIDLSSIGEGILLFFSLYIFTKILQWFLSSRVFPNTSLDSGLRHAIMTITGYIGVITAIILALGSLGLNMSNLAIVAGALSVGIGFGLQAVFNNFVSGLILLFERPLKVGDWIVAGTYQGRIKKIRVRATEIETFQNASVIVPNSMLISDVVTNWTLHNDVGRIEIVVGVAYGSDVQKVKEILLKIAEDNPQVRNYPAPHVLFMNFGDSSLTFELRCHVRNIGDGLGIASEMRFAIEAAFREHHIEIPYPQRDVHIRSSEILRVMSINENITSADNNAASQKT